MWVNNKKMSISTILILALIGLIAGFVSGLLGVGGGIVIVPLMMLIFGASQLEAQGTSLAVLAVPVTLIAAYSYYAEGYLNVKYAIVIALMFVVGGYLGSKLAITINKELLKKIFAVAMLIVAIKMFFGK
jgi:hypothetical protein